LFHVDFGLLWRLIANLVAKHILQKMIPLVSSPFVLIKHWIGFLHNMKIDQIAQIFGNCGSRKVSVIYNITEFCIAKSNGF